MIRSSILALVVSLVTSCGAAQNPIAQALIDCTTVDVGKTLPEIGETLVAYVVQIATSDDPSVEFANIVLKYGNDAAACAMKIAADIFSAHPPHIKAAPSPYALKLESFISSRGWRYR